uniref:hypothetical protein n=1 Tax=Escherichia coli TaxID=562 RepID=UPI002283E76C
SQPLGLASLFGFIAFERTGSAAGVTLFRITFHPVSNRDCPLCSLAMLFEGLWWVVQVSNL